MSFEQKLEKYAEVAIRSGINLRPGQRLLIGTPALRGVPLATAPLVRALVRQAYKAGARFVDVIWDDPESWRLRFEHAPRNSFDEYHTWKVDVARDYAEKGDAIITVTGADPHLLDAQDPELVAHVQRLTMQHAAPFSAHISQNSMNWLVLAAPVPGWTDSVLPNVPEAEREAKLWELLFEICRMNNSDPVAGWAKHIKALREHSATLNQRSYTALKFTAPGTDLTVGLPVGHIWSSAGFTAKNGVPFVANIPTEEVFTLPHRERVQGTVRATKPLNYGGTLIDDFSLIFENGRVVKASAGKGEVSLMGLLDSDEGARRLGEVALVPNSSPISQLNRLFYNILIDENASNHLALGRAYRFSLTGGTAMTDEQFVAAGGNNSIVHVDFMFGSGEMNVDGIMADGRAEPVMRAGEWAPIG